MPRSFFRSSFAFFSRSCSSLQAPNISSQDLDLPLQLRAFRVGCGVLPALHGCGCLLDRVADASSCTA